MQKSTPDIVSLLVVVSTLLLALMVFFIIRYIMMYQERKFKDQQNVLELHKKFEETLLLSKLEIREQTLNHIGSELHANISHLVSLININLSELLHQSSPQARENILETKSMTRQLSTELRVLNASLNKDYINHIGFADALENEMKRLSKRLQIQVTSKGLPYRLPTDHDIILLRLCQEVLNNVLKYAKAKSVIALLDYSPDLFTLEITDDGVGFDVEQALRASAAKQSTGLINIQSRATHIKGKVFIESAPGDGTRFIIRIPVAKAENLLT